MDSSRQTRSSVLGKRSQVETSSPCGRKTPVPSSKRARTSLDVSDANKENIPPFNLSPITPTSNSPRAIRALRRNNTDSVLTTPSRRRSSASAVSNAAIPSTPCTDMGQLSLTTPPPTPPSVLQPLHARVRALLRPTCDTDHTMPGRELESATLSNFILSFLGIDDEECDATNLFISGSPGTGKTALVNCILRSYASALSDSTVIHINCMTIQNVDALWSRLNDELEFVKSKKGGKKTTKKIGDKEQVEHNLSSLTKKCIIILDELDNITTNLQALNALFALSSAHSSVLRVIGIANTHTLGASSSDATITAPIQTLHFAPYSPTQLQQILKTRLSPLYEAELKHGIEKFLPAPVLMLLTKKIAAQTGDVRSLFEVLVSAISVAVSESMAGENPLGGSVDSVKPTHVLAAFKAISASKPAAATTSTSNSEVVVKVKGLGLQSRMTLLAIILAAKRLESGLALNFSPQTPSKRFVAASASTDEAIDVSFLHTFYCTVLERATSGVFSAVSRVEFRDLISLLDVTGLVTHVSCVGTSPQKGVRKSLGRSASFSFGANKRQPAESVRLAAGIRADEVLRGLFDCGASDDIVEEELRSIWERENTKLRKDLKVTTGNVSNEAISFENAMKDRL